MKKSWTMMGLVVGVCLTLAPAGFGQFVYPPNLVDDVQITRIDRWEITKNEATGRYEAKLDVVFANASDYFVVFREAKFEVSFEVPKHDEVSEKRTGVIKTKEGREEDIYSATPKNPLKLPFGDALLPQGEEGVPELALPAGAKDAVKKFIVDLGPAGPETTDRLIPIFNMIMNNKPDWTMIIKGDAKVGLRGPKSKATIMSSNPIDIEIKSKPKVKVEVDLQGQ